MTPGERLSLSLKAMREAWPLLFHGPPEIVARRFAAIRRENDVRNHSILERLAAAQDTLDEES
jgi:hypothetical protein